MNRKKVISILLFVAVLLLSATGCVHEELTYQFNKDGTGSLSVVLTMAEAYMEEATQTESNVFDITQEDLSNLEGVALTQTPVEEMINGQKFIGTKIEMAFADAEAFLSSETGSTFNVVDLPDGNKRLEFVMSTEEATEETVPQTPEEQAQTMAIMQALNMKIALNIKTDYNVIASNATSVNNDLYTWDLMEMAMSAADAAEPLCYIEYVPEADSSGSLPILPQQTVKALPTTSTVLVNGAEVEFDAYNINGNNYFKLRDVAAAITGSEKQFGVEWDAAKRAINLTSNSLYVQVGGELSKGAGIVKTGILNGAPIYKDGVQISLTAYNIDGNNYFKLRDLGASFDIGIFWDDNTKTIRIDTAAVYAE